MRGSRSLLAAVAALVVACGGPPAATAPTGSAPRSLPSDTPPPRPPPSPTSLAGSEVVRFPSPDGIRLEGRLFGDGDTAVVFAHQLDNDQSAWFGLALDVAAAGHRALTFNFRGYCPRREGGCSDGVRDLDESWRDVIGAIEHVSGIGASRIVLVGASMGGEASIIAAARSPADVHGLITLSASKDFIGLLTDEDYRQIVRRDVERLSEPMLLIAAELDRAAVAHADAYAEFAGGEAVVRIYPVSAHGTELINATEVAIDVRELLLLTIAEVAAA